MDPITFVEWLDREVDQFAGKVISNEIRLVHAQKICYEAHDVIETMSVEERRNSITLLANSIIKSRNILDKYLEDQIESIFATVFGFLEQVY